MRFLPSPGTFSAVLACTALALAAAIPAPAAAQPRRGGAAGGRALEIGPRVGYEYRSDDLLVGAQLRLPVDPWQRVDFLPSVDLTFRSGFTERQYNLDGAVYLDGARALYVGAGATFLDTFFLDDEGGLLDERETRTGYSLFGGLHGSAGAGTFIPQVEFRWGFVDVFRPRTISLGLNYPVPLGF